MNRNWIRRLVILIVFIASLIGFSFGMNKGNTDMTIEMPKASMPVAYIMIDDLRINEMHGYVQRMDVATMRESLTPIGEDRELSFKVDLYGQEPEEVRFEVRNVDGSRLIEDTRVTDYFREDDSIRATVLLKDLIEENTEYNFILIITLEDNREIFYYTRVMQGNASLVNEKMNYVLDFHAKTFDKELAKELSLYLEPNSDGDNSNFGNVDIHSNLDQVSWGNLPVREIAEPALTICEIGKTTASVRLQSIVEIKEDNVTNVYRVQEFYRIRHTTERFYLLNYYRTMEELFMMEKSSFANNKIVLGIQKDAAQMEESDGGNILAFTNAGRIYSYNAGENKFAQLFAFADADNFDARTYYDCSDVKILDVEENGNVSFMVYGYMNRGTHEGEVGIEVCYYNSLMNTVEEQIFIEYDKFPRILIEDLEKLAYINKNNELFILMDGAISKIDIDSKKDTTIVSGLREENFYVSQNDRVVVWQDRDDALSLMNLNTEETLTFNAGENEYCKPIGFMNEDVIYGIANEQDVSVDKMGTSIYPMKKLVIRAENGSVLKTYESENIYVMEGEIIENQLNLTRVEGVREEVEEPTPQAEEGLEEEEADDNVTEEAAEMPLGKLVELKPIVDDQITSNVEVAEGTNKIISAVTDLYETIWQIELKKEIEVKGLKFLTPKVVLYEGGRRLTPEEQPVDARYLVYTKGRLSEIYSDEAMAVAYAYQNVGTVLDYYGNEIYKRAETVERNQIMAIQAEKVTDEKDSMAVCLDTILQFEGISRNTEYMLAQGQNAQQIMEENLKDYDVLNLTGCPMDVALYYMNQDIPVLARQGKDSYVLIIGFNQQNVVLFDPEIGKIFKHGMNDSREMFAESGNCFVTYARTNSAE